MTDSNPAEDPQLNLHLRAFGARLRTVRRAHEVTQQQLAERTGLGRSHIAAIEAGQINLSLTTIWRLARALNVHAGDLVDDRDR